MVENMSKKEILKHVSFNDQAVGAYSGCDVKKDFKTWLSWGTWWPWNRTKITKASEENLHKRVLIVKYPKGKIRPKDSGASWFCSDFQKGQDRYLSYWVKFSDRFVFRAGGKIHGLTGGTANTGGRKPNGNDGWSTRAHWGPDNKINTYVYHKDQPGKYGESFYWAYEPEPYWIQSGGHSVDSDKLVRITPGEWHHVTIRTHVNDPGCKNGFTQAWFNGRLVLNVHGFEFRSRNCFKSELLVNKMYFSTFFGGNSNEYKPVKNEYAYFDNFLMTDDVPDVPCVIHDEAGSNLIFLKKPAEKLFNIYLPGEDTFKYGYGMRLEWEVPADVKPDYFEIVCSKDSIDNFKPIFKLRDAGCGNWANHHGHAHFKEYRRCLTPGEYYYAVRGLDSNKQPITEWSNIASEVIYDYKKPSVIITGMYDTTIK